MVRDAIASGAVDRSRIAENTGLARTTVDASIEHLERMGWMRIAHRRNGTGCAGFNPSPTVLAGCVHVGCA